MWAEILAALPVPLPTLLALWAGAFTGGLAAGAAGFAFGIASAAIWLHAIDPVRAAFLIVAGGLTIQAGTIWPLRGSLDWHRLWPFLLAGVAGVPVGVWLLVRTDTGALKVALGIFLAIYGVYALLAPRLPHVEAGRVADMIVGLLAGIMGGIGGYSGVAPAIWAQLRGWPKNVARAFYQPLIVVAHVATLVALSTVALDRTGLIMFALALPALALGAWAGCRIYGRLDERRFRQMFAVLLIVSGVVMAF
jgi:uncharacterized membrane protein YfcA